METEATVDRFSFYEKNDYVNNIHNQIFNQWNSQEGNLLGLSEAFPNEGFGFDIKFSEGSRGFVRDGVKILSDNSNEQLLPEPKSQYYAGGGPIGSGLLSMEDAKLMKEFLGSEEFKVYLSDIGEGFVTGLVDMGKDTLDLAKIVAKYGVHPSGFTIFQIASAVHKFRAANGGKELEVIREGASKVAKETWREIVETTTTGKGHGRILAEVTGGFVVGKGLKVFKIAGKVVDEVMDAVPDAKVCPREFGLGEKLDFKPHSPVDADDLGGKAKSNDLHSEQKYGNLNNLDEVKLFSPDFDILYSSSSVAYKDSTKLAHALSKHAGRHPEIWGNIKGAPKTWHAQAHEHLQSIINGPGHFQKIKDPKTGISWIEKRLPDGRGLRLNIDNTFKGFLSPNE